MAPKLPADLSPTSEAPGLRVRGGTQYTRSQGDYACHCGATDRANGDPDVRDLVDDYTANHGPAHTKGTRR
ncbi:hypothetical protein [Actinacidiphila glaucinigra]|uniref:hypothetical protein n=1 Tax=Actinacidiphila glaucinigra TaxID=235986 RepID=UPI0035DBCC23